MWNVNPIKIVKKVDNQSEFNPSTSLQQQQSIYTDPNQLVNYQQQTGNAAQQLYSTNNEQQYEQTQQQSGIPATNYYTPIAQTSNYIYTQPSTEFQSNYEPNQLSNLTPLDLSGGQNLTNQHQIYQQPNYSNYAQQQTSPYFDQQQWSNATTLNQQQPQITPLSAYQTQQHQFSFNQYAQDNQMLSIPFSVNQSTNQFIQNSINNQQGQLTNQINEQNQSFNQTNFSQQQQFSQQQLNVQNNQNIPPNLQSVLSSNQTKLKQNMVTSAAAGTIAPPLLNKIKQKMASCMLLLIDFRIDFVFAFF